jgi:hypothetical protein
MLKRTYILTDSALAVITPHRKIKWERRCFILLLLVGHHFKTRMKIFRWYMARAKLQSRELMKFWIWRLKKYSNERYVKKNSLLQRHVGVTCYELLQSALLIEYLNEMLRTAIMTGIDGSRRVISARPLQWRPDHFHWDNWASGES